MTRIKNRFLKSVAITLGSILPAVVLSGCAGGDAPTSVEEAASESAEALGVEVVTCSQPGSSGFIAATQVLSITLSTPTVVFGVVSGNLTVNGYPCVKKTADGGGTLTPAMVKKVNITGTVAAEKVVIDTLGGALGSTILSATGGITVDMAGGTDSFSLRGSDGADKWSVGESASDAFFEVSGDTTADIRVIGSESYAVSLSGANDTFSARGGAIVASHLVAPATLTTLSALAGAITVNGGDGDDTITGGQGNDVLGGGNGNDTFKTHTTVDGNDTVNGGAGTDKMDYTGRTVALTVVMNGVATSGQGVEADVIGADVEDLVGGTAADTLTGNLLANRIQGGDGNDVISGGPAGNCASDIDVLDGEAGNDTFNMNAVLDCGDTLNGGAGSDRADYQGRAVALTLSIDSNANDGITNEKDNIKGDVEVIISGSAADTITGSTNADEIHGGPGGDTISGGGGNDILTGNSGNDTLNGEAGDDTFDESGVDTLYTVAENKGDGNDVMNGGTHTLTGLDKVSYAARTANLTATLCADTSKPTGNSALTGQCADSDGDPLLTEADKIVNVQHLVGGTGNDTLKGHTDNDTIEGGAGTDTINGGAGGDSLFGDDANDSLFGDDGDDYLDGVAGTDALDGDNVSNVSDADICVVAGTDTSTNCEL